MCMCVCTYFTIHFASEVKLKCCTLCQRVTFELLNWILELLWPRLNMVGPRLNPNLRPKMGRKKNPGWFSCNPIVLRVKHFSLNVRMHSHSFYTFIFPKAIVRLTRLSLWWTTRVIKEGCFCLQYDKRGIAWISWDGYFDRVVVNGRAIPLVLYWKSVGVAFHDWIWNRIYFLN